MAPTSSSVITGVVLNLLLAVGALVVFSFLRTWRKAYKFYDSRRYTPDVVTKPHTVPSTKFGWIKFTFFYPEADIIKQCGLDTAIYLRILKFGFELFVLVSAWCLVTVLPTNVTDDEIDNLRGGGTDFKASGFDKLSLANVQPRSHRMWVHIVTVYVVTGITLWLLWKYSKESVLLRLLFLANSPPGGAVNSVLVTDIPAVADATAKGVRERKEAEDAAAGKTGKRILGMPLPGGKLEVAPGGKQVGPADEEAGRASLKGDGEADIKPMHAAHAPGSAAAAPSTAMASVASHPGQRRVYEYDLKSKELDPRELAERKLQAGATPEELVRDEFQLVYGDQVSEVQEVYDQSGLNKLVAEWEKRTSDLQDFLSAVQHRSAESKPLPDPTVTLLFPDAWCKAWAKEHYNRTGRLWIKVPAMPFWRDRLAYLEEQIALEQFKARRLVWPSAFVTYKTRVAQSISATGMQQHDETTWLVQNAPEPREVIWANLGMTRAERSSRMSSMLVLFWLMTLFYIIPVGAIQGLIDVPKLAKIPGLKQFLNAPVIKQLIEAIVPGLVLKIFLALVPLILATMMRKGGAVSESQVDFGVVSRFFIFQVVVVFFGNVLASSFFSQAQQWINDPGSVVTVLGTAIPQAATFFITYIWVNWGAVAIGFLRIVGLVLMWVFMFLAGSPRAADRVFQEQYTSCGTNVTPHTIIILLGIVFSCINPIVAPSALVYFAIATITEKYNNIFVYRRKYESGGQLWKRVLNQVMFALYLFQLCMIGLISIKKFPYSVLMVPVLIPTAIFHRTVLQLFARPWSITSLHDAAMLDINDRAAASELAEKGGAEPQPYLSPVFKVHKGDAAPYLSELDAVQPRVEADVAQRAADKAAKKGRKPASKST